MKKKICTLFTFTFLFIVCIQAQDYLLSFEGSGASTTVTTVKVENLTQGTSKTVSGGDLLHLKGVITGIESNTDYKKNGVSFSPNPMISHTRMQFILPEAGETIIALYDLSGREVCQTKSMLYKGQQSYRIENLSQGIYFVRIRCGRYSGIGKLISSGPEKGYVKIEYEHTVISQEKHSDSKGTMGETLMQYTTGDRLKLTGVSGNYSTVITDVPAASKAIKFNFVACSDNDGNNYPVVLIGSAKGETGNIDSSTGKGIQIWMAENLKTATLNDGTAIQLVNNDADWGTITTPAFGWYINNAAAYKDIYGGYYNWYAVNTGKLCPSGWRVPNDSDWSTLFSSLGGASIAGGKLKATGLTYWMSPNTGGTNESGFTGLAGGSRYPSNGAFAGLKYLGSWWTTSQADQGYGFFKELQFDLTVVNQAGMVKGYGRNVRCLKE